MKVHLVIPDTQIKPGVPVDHLEWIGKYIVHYKPDVIVHLGDHYDLPSLSSYDFGKKAAEGRRVIADIECATDAFRLLNAPMKAYNAQKRKNKEKLYKPRKIFTEGNHENRATRASEMDAKIDGLIPDIGHIIRSFGWEFYPFLDPVEVDGISYAHYFYQPMSGRPYSGENLLLRLKNISHSFTMGHQQGKAIAQRYLSNGTTQRGLVVGSAYLHDEDYKGPQANHHWRGIIVKHEVKDGNYDLMEVSLDFLCRKYEQMRLDKFLSEKYPELNTVLKVAA